jgi:UDP-N-acetylglucosamine 2-epimerase
MKILLVAGTRPQLVKSAAITRVSGEFRNVEIEFVHTGQHYDFELSRIFFQELDLPRPSFNLEVGSGSHVYQTAQTMLRLEKYLNHRGAQPDFALVAGDTNSALGSVLALSKLGIATGHIEAGPRSFDTSVFEVEEINRRLIDHASKLLFAPTRNSARNLRNERVLGEVHFSGDVMYDVYRAYSREIDAKETVRELGLEAGEYDVLTMHRFENVDNPSRLGSIMKAVSKAGVPVVFPAHPRSRKRLASSRLLRTPGLMTISPLGYLEMLKLVKESRMVMTDSGGLQKEAYWSGIPCLTLKENTEWVETVESGLNYPVGADYDRICRARNRVLEKYGELRKRSRRKLFGDGHASESILKTLLRT